MTLSGCDETADARQILILSDFDKCQQILEFSF